MKSLDLFREYHHREYYLLLLFSLFHNRIDIYSEEHAADALGGSKQSTFWESQGASEGHMMHAESISNPAIPGAPPEV